MNVPSSCVIDGVPTALGMVVALLSDYQIGTHSTSFDFNQPTLLFEFPFVGVLVDAVGPS